ncbi:MAG: MoaD/ThiS family protein [Anaerolineales bacterium]|jgi:molybdopterin converting factor small subunit
MQIPVRLGSGLSQYSGSPRLQLSMPEGTTVAQLIDQLGESYPQMRARLGSTVAVISGRHASPTETLSAGEEVALLIPISGGAI